MYARQIKSFSSRAAKQVGCSASLALALVFCVVCGTFTARAEPGWSAENIVVIGSMAETGRINRAREAIRRAGIEHDFLPLEFLAVRGLAKENYRLALFFPPYGRRGDDLQNADEVYATITEYFESGGKGIIFVPGWIGGKVEKHALGLVGARGLSRGRDNPDNVRTVRWLNPEGEELVMKQVPSELSFHHISEPEAEGARILGYWYDHRDARMSPAVIRTKFGYVANISIFGDSRLFLSSAAAELAPEAAPEIFDSLARSCSARYSALEGKNVTARGQAKTSMAVETRRAADAAAGGGDFIKANRLILEAERKLVEAYAVSMESVRVEKRMIGLTALTHPDPDIICGLLARAGFNGVQVFFRPGDYPSELFGVTEDDVETDWLRKWIDAAHGRGLEMGVSVNAFRIYDGSKIAERAEKEGWHRVGGDMSPDRIANPCRTHPEVFEFAVAQPLEIIKNYPVDAVVLDHIRWEGDRCYCDVCREKFQRDTGIRVENWPFEALEKHRDAFMNWGAEQVTRVVRETSKNIERVNPDITFGVSLRPGEAMNIREGQHWWEWTDYVDYLNPFHYTDDNESIEALLERYNRKIPPGARARLLPIMAVPGYGRVDDFTALTQIELQRKHAPEGIRYFHYFLMPDSYLELLATGPFRRERKEVGKEGLCNSNPDKKCSQEEEESRKKIPRSRVKKGSP